MAIWELPKVRLTVNDNPWNCSDCRFAVKAFKFVAGQPDRIAGLNSRYHELISNLKTPRKMTQLF